MQPSTQAALRIAIVGDFNRGKHSHWATEAALFHAAASLGLRVAPHWIGTTAIGTASAEVLSSYDGVWGAPGSPFASPEGMLRAIAYARVHDVPYLGTCAGFQYALIEFTRNVLGIADADSSENHPDGGNIVITLAQCVVPEAPAGTPRLSGAGVARVVPGTKLERICGAVDLRGEFYCSLEANPQFASRWRNAGLRPAALSEGGAMRAFELPDKRFFVATLFQPQLSSSFERPHPIIAGFLRACARETR